MRTTLTLDDDVAAKLKAEVRKSGRSFKQTVNEFLRLGLNAPVQGKPVKRFKVKARPLGLKPGFSYDCVNRLIEQVEQIEQAEGNADQWSLSTRIYCSTPSTPLQNSTGGRGRGSKKHFQSRSLSEWLGPRL